MKTADYILYNGKIYTSDTQQPWATAVAVNDGLFICVGSMEDCEVFKGENTELIDLGGKVVLPGMIDGHTHPETIAKSRWRIQMPEFETKEELLSWVRDYCEEHPKEELPYFFGECYPSTMFDENGPRKEWIDKYVSDRPVRLQDFTDHACWYNSMALELLEVDNEKPDNKDFFIFVRDDNGEPTGWVLEPIPTSDIEETMYRNLGWHPPTKVTTENIMPFMDFLSDHGVTGMIDALTEGEDAIKVYHELDMEGQLKLYCDCAFQLEKMEDMEACIQEIKRLKEKYTSKHVSIHTMKFFMDGTNEMGTSASLEPLYNDPEQKSYGDMCATEEELTALLLRLNEEKIDLHIHVVCDRGFRTCCDAYEKALAIAAERGDSWDIFMELAHCELVHPDDMKRPAELGIIINFSSHWAGGYFGEAGIEYLGIDRWNTMYDFTKMIDSGAVVTFSSDVIGMCEEKRGNPFFGMEIAATRVDLEEPLDPERYPGSIRQPESAKLSVEQLLRGYTAQSVVPMRMADKLGTITVGKIANLSVLDRNIFEIPLTDIHNIETEAVMFDGKFIKRSEGV